MLGGWQTYVHIDYPLHTFDLSHAYPYTSIKMKYWNKQRIQRKRDREKRAERRAFEKSMEEFEKSRRYSAGDYNKNANLALDALGSPLRRKMLARLRRDGAMSLSKLARPFRLQLTTALSNILALERAGLVRTHKQGRVRMCIYNKIPVQELAEFLKKSRMDF